MPLIIIAAGVALLLILMIGFKVNGFIALVLVAAVVGFCRRDGCTGRPALYTKWYRQHARRAGNDPRFRGHVRQADF